MNKLHASGWVIAAVLAFVALKFHDAKVRADEHAQVTADSLHRVQAHLDSATHAAQESVTVAHQREARVLGQVAGQQRALQAAQGTLDTLRKLLRDSLSGSQQLALDSLETLHAAREAILTSQRNSALALFRGAASQRDTLSALLSAAERQAAGLQAALIQARRVPLLSRTPFKVVELGLALYGAARLAGR
jgi:hypothetical protein